MTKAREFFGQMVDGAIVNDPARWGEITTPVGTLRAWNVGASFDWAYRNDWQGFYNFLDLAAKLDARTLYTMAGEPGSTLPSLANWKRFVSEAVRRAEGRISIWEVMNEPQYLATNDPAQVVALARAAYSIIKASDPSAIVLTPSLSAYSDFEIDYTRKYLNAMRGSALDRLLAIFRLKNLRSADAIAYHGYCSSATRDLPVIIGRLRDLKRQYGFGDLPLYDTEISLSGGYEALHETYATQAAMADVNLVIWDGQNAGMASHATTTELGRAYVDIFRELTGDIR